jgi:hypothetical protein
MKTIMKKLLLLLILTGCSRTISSWELKAVTEECTSYGGIYSVEILSYGTLFLICNSGHAIEIDRYSLQKDRG